MQYVIKSMQLDKKLYVLLIAFAYVAAGTMYLH